MPGAFKPEAFKSKLVELLVALVAGTAAAAVIWALGSPALSWLGFVAAGLAFAGNSARCSFRSRRSSS